MTLEENLAKYRQFFKEAEASPDYWHGAAVVDFTVDLCRLMEEQNVSRAELARRIGNLARLHYQTPRRGCQLHSDDHGQARHGFGGRGACPYRGSAVLHDLAGRAAEQAVELGGTRGTESEDQAPEGGD